jgi:transposase
LAKVIEQGSKERSRVMLIIGCDFHSRFQQIAMLDPTTGEIIERRSEHENGEAKMFYAMLPRPARVGMETTCDAPWFERVLQEHHHELWIGDAAQIRAAMVRKQKTDSRDARHILDLLCTNRFPRIRVPSLAERDLRQMLRHRHKLVRFRTSVMNQLHALAMGQGLCRRKKLWAKAGRKELEGLVLDPWASLRRDELLQLLDQFDPWIAKLDEAVAAESRPEAVCLMQQAGVGPVTALAFVLTIGPVSRFANSKKLVSYLGLNPSEESTGGRQRLGAISKQGNPMMRCLLVEAAQTASRLDPELRRDYQRLKFRRGSAVAKVAMARKLAVRLYWKLREAAQPVPSARMQGSPASPVVGESLSPN